MKFCRCLSLPSKPSLCFSTTMIVSGSHYVLSVVDAYRLDRDTYLSSDIFNTDTDLPLLGGVISVSKEHDVANTTKIGNALSKHLDPILAVHRAIAMAKNSKREPPGEHRATLRVSGALVYNALKPVDTKTATLRHLTIKLIDPTEFSKEFREELLPNGMPALESIEDTQFALQLTAKYEHTTQVACAIGLQLQSERGDPDLMHIGGEVLRLS
jgi:hypothetical protein